MGGGSCSWPHCAKMQRNSWRRDVVCGREGCNRKAWNIVNDAGVENTVPVEQRGLPAIDASSLFRAPHGMRERYAECSSGGLRRGAHHGGFSCDFRFSRSGASYVSLRQGSTNGIGANLRVMACMTMSRGHHTSTCLRSVATLFQEPLQRLHCRVERDGSNGPQSDGQPLLFSRSHVSIRSVLGAESWISVLKCEEVLDTISGVCRHGVGLLLLRVTREYVCRDETCSREHCFSSV